jgi:hypothetical protein
MWATPGLLVQAMEFHELSVFCGAVYHARRLRTRYNVVVVICICVMK